MKLFVWIAPLLAPHRQQGQDRLAEQTAVQVGHAVELTALEAFFSDRFEEQWLVEICLYVAIGVELVMFGEQLFALARAMHPLWFRRPRRDAINSVRVWGH